MAKQKIQVREIALYGNRDVGFGYLACVDNAIVGGTGDPSLSRPSLTECVFSAVRDLKAAGHERGPVLIFAPGGKKVAKVDLGDVPVYGAMTWKEAPVYQIAVKDLLAGEVAS